LDFASKSYIFLSCWTGRPILQYLRATVSLLTLTPHPYLRRPFAVGEQIEKRRGKRERKRREEKRWEIRACRPSSLFLSKN